MVIRQDPFSISLDASALLAVSILLVIGMHTVGHLLIECLTGPRNQPSTEE
jgi:hypothetical protein